MSHAVERKEQCRRSFPTFASFWWRRRMLDGSSLSIHAPIICEPRPAYDVCATCPPHQHQQYYLTRPSRSCAQQLGSNDRQDHTSFHAAIDREAFDPVAIVPNLDIVLRDSRTPCMLRAVRPTACVTHAGHREEVQPPAE